MDVKSRRTDFEADERERQGGDEKLAALTTSISNPVADTERTSKTLKPVLMLFIMINRQHQHQSLPIAMAPWPEGLVLETPELAWARGTDVTWSTSVESRLFLESGIL